MMNPIWSWFISLFTRWFKPKPEPVIGPPPVEEILARRERYRKMRDLLGKSQIDFPKGYGKTIHRYPPWPPGYHPPLRNSVQDVRRQQELLNPALAPVQDNSSDIVTAAVAGAAIGYMLGSNSSGSDSPLEDPTPMPAPFIGGGGVGGGGGATARWGDDSSPDITPTDSTVSDSGGSDDS